MYRAAATSLATRHADGSLPDDDFNIELANQSGEKVQLGTEEDQKYDHFNKIEFYMILLSK